MLLPIILILNLYRLDRVVQLVVLFFGISMMPGIWHIAAWIDQVLLANIWGDKSYIEGVTSIGHAAWALFP